MRSPIIADGCARAPEAFFIATWTAIDASWGASAARQALAAAKDELPRVGDDPLAILYLEPTCRKKLPACADDADFCQE